MKIQNTLKAISTIAILLAAIITIFPMSASAILGEPATVAKSRAGQWQSKYGAVAPIIHGDGKGIAVFECWSGPPEMWSMTTAMAFARQLLPKAIRNAKPSRTIKDGGTLIYTFRDGYRISLPTFENKVIDVGVYSPDWKGADC